MADPSGDAPQERDLTVLQWEDKARAREIGWIGLLFGGATEKPGNIAGLVVFASVLLFASVILWGVDTPSLSKKDALLIVAGFISLSLGFLFGQTSKK